MEVLILIKSGKSPEAEKQAYKFLYLKYTGISLTQQLNFINSTTNHTI